MTSISSILNSLDENSSRLAKLVILKDNLENDLLKRVIVLALDPMIQFYVKKIPKYQTPNNPSMSLEDALDGLGVLSKRQKTGHAAIDHLSNILSSISFDDADVIKRIIAKDLKCGVAIATVNDVWPKLVFDYPCMTTSAFDQKLIENFRYPAWAQLKYDGMRFNAIVQGDFCELRSRNGKLINLHGCLEKEFIQMVNGENLVFDGELLIKENGKVLDRKTGNGVLNKAVKGTISNEESEKVCAILWDLIPYEPWFNEHYEKDYYNRFRQLGQLKNTSHKIEIVNNIKVNSVEEAEAAFHDAISKGYEGIILKALHWNWENKRIKGAVKFKSEKECDLVIKDVVSGEGKYSGMMGALICETSDGLLSVNVGTGFTDQDRSRDWKSCIGMCVSIRYNERITSKTNNHRESLFLPRFIEIRNDKTVADSIGDIK